MKILLTAIFCFFSLFSKVLSQSVEESPRYTYTAGLNYFSGFAVKHDRFMGHLSNGITQGIEFNINKNTYGYQIWEQVFKYPDVGFSMSYYDYGSDKLGQSIGGVLYVDFFLFRTNKLEGFFKIGTGFGYHTNPYDRESNNQNVAIGSKFSQSMQLRGGVNYQISDRWKLTAATTISHFSVAAFTQPNKGINVITANLGCAYRLANDIPGKVMLDTLYQWDRRLKYNANFSYAVKEIPPIGGPKFPVYVFTFYINKQVSKTNIINLGIDGFSNTALMEEMRQSDIDPMTIDHKRLGIAIGHELKLHRVSLLTQFGAYIYRPYKTDKPVYQRLALKFYLGENIYLHYGFLTHFAKADHAEWGIGFTL